MTNRTITQRRMRHGLLALFAALAVALSGCAHSGPRATVGAAGGAAAGGLLASALGGESEAIGAGVILGGLLGGAVGDSLDRVDRMYAADTAQYALEYDRSGTTSTWHNPDTGHYGSVTPVETYQTARGEYCREFQQTVTVGGRTEDAYGTACREPDGSWRILQ